MAKSFALVSSSRRQAAIAALALAAIVVHLALRYGGNATVAAQANWPLWIALALGGVPLVLELLGKLLRREFGSDLLAGISIVASVVLGEYLAGTLVVLMLSGGEALENYAVRSASSVLAALAKRMPSVAHRKHNDAVDDVALEEVAVGDVLVVFPHEVCPVDGTVIAGRGVMDESYLTGEPYDMAKTPGSPVLSGSINGDTALTIRTDKQAVDSRYAKIMEVMQSSQQQRPQLRRLGDQLGAYYTPIAVALAIAAWAASGEAIRFLAVLVVATPCPLLIAIPVAIIGSISLAARRAIIIRDPAALERADRCRTVILDKTGTLTYGAPQLVGEKLAAGFAAHDVLALAASVERYSKHPLAAAIRRAGVEQNVPLAEVGEISEAPGAGLSALVDGRRVRITNRDQLLSENPAAAGELPPPGGGMECVVLIDDRLATTYQFRDAPRHDGAPFVEHLAPQHGVQRIMLLSGDRESEVRYLADAVGVSEIYASQSPEEKLEHVRRETAQGDTLFVGDGINDAPALVAATVGIAFGQASDVTTEAADVVVMDSSLAKLDEFMHISQRMRRIALQSAVGGMAASVVGMLLAAAGYLPPVAGAVTQEVIDVIAVLNALRAAWPPKTLSHVN
ncbi:MAG: heavy metal translocating P-type ATPase [Planctomycetaceae bacterium]|nr:heavy metal translocating P-type ATPase [Planctomycetaceae bacterium]